jgi:GAF domain-containing protein
MAIAAGIQQTVLISLTISGRRLGYLQAGDKLDGSPFDDSDLHLLEIICNQAAAIIENAMLVRESQERAKRSEALRRIASLVSSTATIDEILSFSLQIGPVIRADMAMIYLLDETLGELQVHEVALRPKPDDTSSTPPIDYSPISTRPLAANCSLVIRTGRIRTFHYINLSRNPFT